MTHQAFDAKVVLLGHSGVGKTSLVVRYVQGVFDKNVKPTVGPAFWTKRLVVDKWKVTLQIWDTCGQERFKSMTPMYYRGAQAAIFVYDVSNRDSLDGIKEWIKELNKNGINTDEIVTVIAANKSDLDINSNLKESLIEGGKNYAKEVKAQWFQTSAKNNQCVEEIFAFISRELLKRSQGIESGEKKGGVELSTKEPEESCC